MPTRWFYELAALWRRATYRTTRPHPLATAAIETLRRRRPQTYNPYPGRPW